jgi:hypothetical protein
MNYYQEQGYGRFEDAKVGDIIAYNPSRYEDKIKLTNVNRVSVRGGRLAIVYCEDGTKWSGSGSKWGDESSFRALHAHLIENLERFEAKRDEIERAQVKKKAMDLLSQNLREWLPHNFDAFSEEELLNLRMLVQRGKARKAAASLADYFARWAR